MKHHGEIIILKMKNHLFFSTPRYYPGGLVRPRLALVISLHSALQCRGILLVRHLSHPECMYPIGAYSSFLSPYPISPTPRLSRAHASWSCPSGACTHPLHPWPPSLPLHLARAARHPPRALGYTVAMAHFPCRLLPPSALTCHCQHPLPKAASRQLLPFLARPGNCSLAQRVNPRSSGH